MFYFLLNCKFMHTMLKVLINDVTLCFQRASLSKKIQLLRRHPDRGTLTNVTSIEFKQQFLDYLTRCSASEILDNQKYHLTSFRKQTRDLPYIVWIAKMH